MHDVEAHLPIDRKQRLLANYLVPFEGYYENNESYIGRLTPGIRLVLGRYILF